jgi:glycosyltransferase involved in cell wall biosynthesis
LEWGGPASTTEGQQIRKLPGINIVGNITAESGTGQAARSIIQAVRKASIPTSIKNIEINVYRKEDKSVKKFSFYNPYPVNLLFINADQTDVIYKFLGPDYFADKYNIGYWLWEQETFPGQWAHAFNYFNEIWTSSSFCANALSKISPIPIVKIPLPVIRQKYKKYKRDYFSLPSNTFIFLFIFDFLSVFERKNPLDLIKAFQKAFPKKGSATLVIKTVNAKYNQRAFLKMNSLIAKNDSIILLDGYFSRAQLDSLVRLCDCYISLHRSEGFGFPIFEAMAHKKPVIATSYSGNVDVMNINNSYPVKYKLIHLSKDEGPYKKGGVWAQPEIDHAATLMQRVYNNQNEAKVVGQKASEDIAQTLNTKTIGNLIKSRLDVIKSIR